MKSIKLLPILLCSLLLVNKESAAADNLLYGTAGVYSGIVLSGGIGKRLEDKNKTFYTSLFGVATNILIARSEMSNVNKLALWYLANFTVAILNDVDVNNGSPCIFREVDTCIDNAEKKCKTTLELIETLHQNQDLTVVSAPMITMMAGTVNKIENCRNKLKAEIKTLNNLLTKIQVTNSAPGYYEYYFKIRQQIERIDKILAINCY